MDLIAHLRRQREFSLRTFGPGRRTLGIIDHIKKELIEVAAAPTDLSEWIDLIILAADGALRADHSPEAIAAALEAKQATNAARTWPDWRTASSSDKAIEHVRECSTGSISVAGDASGEANAMTARAVSCPVAWRSDVPQRGDAHALLKALLDSSATVVIFDPQHRSTLNKQKYGNEGERQRERCALPQMSDEYIDRCCREAARVLRPSGYLMLWADTFRLCQAHHLRVTDVLLPVDLIAWDSRKPGQGYRARRYGAYLLVLQKPPLRAKTTWIDHSISDRWAEKVDRKIHPHIKPRELLARLIGAVSRPGDLVVDPAAGSFITLEIARLMGRRFIGCDLAWKEPNDTPPESKFADAQAPASLTCGGA
jgi:site-specific DNA-methyltransferase (adenine-specific)